MLTKMKKKKKKHKNLKIVYKIHDIEIWCRGSYPQNLAWIYAAVSEKPECTDGRTPAPRL